VAPLESCFHTHDSERALPWMGHRSSLAALLFSSRTRSLRLSKGDELQKYLLIAIGGALGSVARYWVGSSIAGRMGVRFPYGTLVVNITACVIIGFSMSYLGRRAELNPAWRFLVPVGFIGAYSTFSTYEWETLSTLRAGAFGIAALYAAGSFVLGLVAVWGGSVLGEMVP
jgi:fluoride exporter